MNFDTFSQSLITVFSLLVNDDWNQTLYIFVKGSNASWIAYIYFISVVIAGNWILL